MFNVSAAVHAVLNMDSLLMQAAREALTTDFGASSTESTQPPASTSSRTNPTDASARTPQPPTHGLNYAHLWGSASATRMYSSPPMYMHTPTRNLTSSFTNSHTSPAYTTRYMDSDMSARAGTALFNTPTHPNSIVAVSPSAYIARAGMHETTFVMNAGSARRRLDSTLIDSLSGHRHTDLHTLRSA